MDLGIRGKVAIVTGGSRGLGKYAALSLAREGVKVAICARTDVTLQTAVAELRAHTPDAIGIPGDVSDEAFCQRIVDETVNKLGPVDILVNNVGRSRAGEAMALTDQQWSELVNVNLMSAVRMSRLVVPGMQSRRWGRIINIASIWGREYGGQGGYMPTKAALIALTKHMALSLAKDGVLVNSVAPGSISFSGGSWERFQRDQPPETVREFISRNLPMGKFGWPEPVGDLVAFLASDRANLITGACINVDGGQSHSLI